MCYPQAALLNNKTNNLIVYQSYIQQSQATDHRKQKINILNNILIDF
jgi:hypothetical protein